MSNNNPLQWTLRFKSHNVTVLFLVSPVQPLVSLTSPLLAALKARNITTINGRSVPDDPSRIEFGIPIDRSNLQKGWQTIDSAAASHANRTRTRMADPSNASPQSLGMKDSHAVAFRFRAPSSVASDTADPGWDVLLPSFDDEDEQ